jgi:hypothetical protein
MNDPVGQHATMNATSTAARACHSANRSAPLNLDPSNDVMSEDSKRCEATQKQGRCSVEKNAEQNNMKEEETVSEREIWLTIRYLDPDTKRNASDIALVVTVVAIVSIVCAVAVLLHLRGLWS